MEFRNSKRKADRWHRTATVTAASATAGYRRMHYEEKLRSKDEQIAYYKDFKARQSTKMVGESLEQHCEIEFNKLRATGFQ